MSLVLEEVWVGDSKNSQSFSVFFQQTASSKGEILSKDLPRESSQEVMGLEIVVSYGLFC